MGRLYLVDSYNVILQDGELNEILDYEGLALARQAIKDVAGDFARRTGSRVRLVFDGAQDPFSHIENSEDEWVEVSFTSTGEKADERLVAIALECRRRGLKPTIVSDDITGIREPLGADGFALLSSAKFVQMMRAGGERHVERRAHALSEETKRGLETEFLARDAESRRRKEREEKAREAARAAPAKPGGDRDNVKPPAARVIAAPRPVMKPEQETAAARSSPPSSASSTTARPSTSDTTKDKKARGLRKQARRLALLQSRRKTKH